MGACGVPFGLARRWFGTLRPAAFAGIASCALAGCITPSYVDRAQDEEPASAVVVDPVVYQVHETFRQAPPKCIAVLPFQAAIPEPADDGVEKTIQPQEVRLVRRAFFAHLAPQQWRSLELNRIDALFESLPDEQRKDLRAVGAALGCDALMTGTVTRHESVYLGLYSRVCVGADVRIVRARDGAMLWEGQHKAVSHGGSMPISIFGAAFGLVDAALNMQGEQMERVTSDLARRLVSTIPEDFASQPAATEYRFVNAESLNVREGPGTRHPIRETLKRSARVAVLDTEASREWLAIRTFAGREGYVSARYLSRTPVDAPVRSAEKAPPAPTS